MCHSLHTKYLDGLGRSPCSRFYFLVTARVAWVGLGCTGRCWGEGAPAVITLTWPELASQHRPKRCVWKSKLTLVQISGLCYLWQYEETHMGSPCGCMGTRAEESHEHLARQVRITVQTHTNHGISQPVSEEGNCYEYKLNNWVLETFGHRSFYLQIISKCCDSTSHRWFRNKGQKRKEKSSGMEEKAN